MLELFAKSDLMGIFKGSVESGYEFSAEVVTPYDARMLERPQLGQFLLIELANPLEASLARITNFAPAGLLSSVEGEDYIMALQKRGQTVPDDLKKDKLKYKVQIKLLGAVKIVQVEQSKDKIIFIPSLRRIPHLGAKVSLPSDEVLRELCSLSQGETDLGNYVLGEFIYSGKNTDNNANTGVHDYLSNFQYIEPNLNVKFNINNIVSKRSVVFARAGYGKSNLIKYLVSELYKDNGKYAVTDKNKKVGTLIFDPDGEYFWPDNKNRPALCDVPHLKDIIAVFTNRKSISTYYGSWKAGDVKLNIKSLLPRDVIGIAISPDRQEQQNIIKLKSLKIDNWKKLVDIIEKDGMQADDKEIAKIMGYNKDAASGQSAEISAAKSNMYNLVSHLHDPNSRLVEEVEILLKEGRVVIVDISLLSSTAGNNVAGLIMRNIFNFNQENFTGDGSSIPVIAIMEEAQSVLGKSLSETSPFVEWVKEGRKYDLGAIMVTQQPGSIAPEILSQSDNWFVFHVLSEGDASILQRYNSFYSKDIILNIINEPIIGNCYMWSAPLQPFVLPVRIRSFESLYKKYIVKEGNPESNKKYENSTAMLVVKRSNERIKLMAEEVFRVIKSDFKNNKLKTQDFSDKNKTGILKGRLYYIVRDVKEKEEFKNEIRKEDDLYKPIFSYIFDCIEDEIEILQGPHFMNGQEESKPFVCIPTFKWNEKMNQK
ncbi:MAG: ATP-binding protein [Candidatus Acidulodesulfobacterium sp.]